MKRIILMLVFSAVCILAFGQGQEIEKTSFAFFDFVKNMDTISFVILGAFLFFGGIMGIARLKLKQLGELCLKLYDFTDDKVLDKKERAETLVLVKQLISFKGLPITAALTKKELRQEKRGNQKPSP